MVRGHDKKMLETMIKSLCCWSFSYDDKHEAYDRRNQNSNQIRFTNRLYANNFVLQGISDLPNEILVEFLFPHLGIYDIRNLGDTGDTRLKYLTEDYLSTSTYIMDAIKTTKTNVFKTWLTSQI